MARLNSSQNISKSAVYEVVLGGQAEKQLDKLPRDIRSRLLSKIQALATNPRPRKSKLRGTSKYRKLRVGDRRVFYEIDEAPRQVIILDLKLRNHAYRDI